MIDTQATTSPNMRGDLQQLAATRYDYDVHGGWEKLERTLADLPPSDADGLSHGDALAASTGSASSAAAGVPVAIKLAIVAAIGGSVALGASWLGREEAPPPVARSAAPAARSAPPPAAEVAPPGPVAAPEAAPAPAPVESAAVPRRAPPASNREIAQLVRIRAALERDPAAAHRLIRAAQREFPQGMLREEREGLDVIALFRMGGARRAREQAERFIERYPRSPLRPRVERILAGENP